MVLKTIEDLFRVVEAETAGNSFAAAQSTATALRVRVPPLISGSVIEIVAREYRTAAGQVTGDLTIGTDRQKSIGDYLRDAANSEATLANLGLQRLVIVPTILTVLIGALALIPGILTEEQKKTLWHGRNDAPTVPSRHDPPTATPTPSK